MAFCLNNLVQMNGPNRTLPAAPSTPLPPHPSVIVNTKDAHTWNVQQVCDWLDQNNFGQFVSLFREHDITGDVLVDLNYALLKEIGIHLVGDRARILACIKRNLRPGSTSSIVTDGQSLALVSPKMEDRRGPHTTSPNRPHKNRHILVGVSPGSPSSELSEADSNGISHDGRNQGSPTNFAFNSQDSRSPTTVRANSLSKNRNNLYPTLAPRSSSINKEQKVSPLSTKSNLGDIHSVRYVRFINFLLLENG